MKLYDAAQMHNSLNDVTYLLYTASVNWVTFEVLLEEVSIGGVRHRAVSSRVARVANTVGASHTGSVTVAHVLALRANVDVV